MGKRAVLVETAAKQAWHVAKVSKATLAMMAYQGRWGAKEALASA